MILVFHYTCQIFVMFLFVTYISSLKFHVYNNIHQTSLRIEIQNQIS